jgi:hypothetical protein
LNFLGAAKTRLPKKMDNRRNLIFMIIVWKKQ